MFLRKKSGRKTFVYSFQARRASKYFTFFVLMCGVLFLSKINVLAVTVLLDSSFDGDGKAFTTFNPYSADPGNDIVVQPDGKIIVAGSGLDTNILVGHWVMARYNADGSLDSGFGSGGKVITTIGNTWDRCNSLALRPDGKIIVAGDKMFNTGDAFDSNVVVARYNANGTLDGSFGSGGVTQTDVAGTNTVNDVTLLSDNKIFVVGNSTNGSPFGVLYSADGFPDTNFDTDGIIIVPATKLNAAASQTDGKLLLAGQIGSSWALWRYNSNGILDTTFDGDGIVNIPVGTSGSIANEMLVKPDGKILTVGTATVADGDVTLVQFNSDGSPDTTFDGDGKVFTNIQVDAGNDIALQPDGKIVALGSYQGVFSVIRYQPNGSLDTSFDGDGIVTAQVSNVVSSALAIQPDGKIVATGSSNQVGFAVIRFSPRAQAFDFDGDNKTDVSIFRPSSGEWWISKSSNGENNVFQFGISSDRIVPGDFTGDGKTDIAVWRPSTGQWFVLRSEDYTYYAFTFGLSGDVPVVADFDGDFKADATIFRPSNNTWYVYKSTGGFLIKQFGTGGDIPIPADFDGDGRADIAVYRPSQDTWWIYRSTDAGTTAFRYPDGITGEKPVAGDFTGDGKADYALSTGTGGFGFVRSEDSYSRFGYLVGASGDIPAPGDYDGDGKMDGAMFHAATGTWRIHLSTTDTIVTQNYGISTDKPVPNAFVP